MFKFSTDNRSNSFWRTALLSVWFLALPAVGISPFYYVTTDFTGESDGQLAGRPGVEVSSSASTGDKEGPVREQGSKSPSTTRNDITLWLVTNSASAYVAPAPAKRLSYKFAYGSVSEVRKSGITQATLRDEASQFSENGKAHECTLLGHKPSGLG